MPDYIKALIYVLIASGPTVFIVRRIAVPVIGEDEFLVWRNCWLATTCISFLSNSFLVFSGLLLLVCVYGFKKAREPLYLYIVLMFAAPCVSVNFGIPGLFASITALDPPRLLAVFILLPIGVSLWRDKGNRKVSLADIFAGGYVLMICALASRLGDLNSVLRACMAQFLGVVVPYFVFSRALRTASDVNRTLLAFAVAALPIAAIGTFEFLKGWPVYPGVAARWDSATGSGYLFRDGMLRASATSMISISFGFMCMVGAGCLFALKTKERFGLWHYAATAVLLAGLFASVSRGPWLGLAICVAVILSTNLKAASKFVAAAVPVGAGLALVSASFIYRFINLLPFVGRADKASETYRSDLFDAALLVIRQHPWFGSPTFLKAPELQKMMQGQGLIDIVNSYLQITLEFGVVTLVFFAAFFILNAVQLAILAMRKAPKHVNYVGILGVLLSIMFTIATTSSVTFVPYIYWTFAAMGVALMRMGLGSTRQETAEPIVSKPQMRVLRAGA
jgi:hypothetical protein